MTGGNLEQILDASAGQILSYDVSSDGKELLVAWRNGPGPDDPERYQIYRMNVDGSGLRQLTRGDHDYRKLLRLFEPITGALMENPRQDMPGSHRPDCEPCEPPALTTAAR
ncbi:MAG: hypothetical protein ABIK89_02590 [Planctomycetota bacterium]